MSILLENDNGIFCLWLWFIINCSKYFNSKRKSPQAAGPHPSTKAGHRKPLWWPHSVPAPAQTPRALGTAITLIYCPDEGWTHDLPSIELPLWLFQAEQIKYCNYLFPHLCCHHFPLLSEGNATDSFMAGESKTNFSSALNLLQVLQTNWEQHPQWGESTVTTAKREVTFQAPNSSLHHGKCSALGLDCGDTIFCTQGKPRRSLLHTLWYSGTKVHTHFIHSVFSPTSIVDKTQQCPSLGAGTLSHTGFPWDIPCSLPH